MNEEIPWLSVPGVLDGAKTPRRIFSDHPDALRFHDGFCEHLLYALVHNRRTTMRVNNDTFSRNDRDSCPFLLSDWITGDYGNHDRYQ